MTKDDKIFLVHFLTRTGMYVNPVDMNNIGSFITGYQAGRKGKCHFWDLCKELVATKYKTGHSSGGLLGQIKKLSKKQSLPEVVTFKKIALEVIAMKRTDTKAIFFFKSRITDLINQISSAMFLSANETSRNYWLSLVNIKQEWFISLWNKKELTAIKAIDKEVLSNIFKHRQQKIIPIKMLLLKEKFERATGAPHD